MSEMATLKSVKLDKLCRNYQEFTEILSVAMTLIAILSPSILVFHFRPI